MAVNGQAQGARTALTISAWLVVAALSIVVPAFMWFFYSLDLTPNITSDDSPNESWRKTLSLSLVSVVALVTLFGAGYASFRGHRVWGLWGATLFAVALAIFWWWKFS